MNQREWGNSEEEEEEHALVFSDCMNKFLADEPSYFSMAAMNYQLCMHSRVNLIYAQSLLAYFLAHAASTAAAAESHR